MENKIKEIKDSIDRIYDAIEKLLGEVEEIKKQLAEEPELSDKDESPAEDRHPELNKTESTWEPRTPEWDPYTDSFGMY